MYEGSRDHSSDDESSELRYYTASESDLTTALLLPVTMAMEAPARERNGYDEKEEQEVLSSSEVTTSMSFISANSDSGEEDKGESNSDYCNKNDQGLGIRSPSLTASGRSEPEVERRESKSDNQCNRRSTPCQSLVGSAQIQFKLFVDEVKVELKGLTQTGNIVTDTTDGSGNKEGTKDIDKKKADGTGTGWRRYLGIMLALSSSMMFALCNVFAKLLFNYYPTNVALWRFQGVFWPALPILFYCRVIKKEKIFDSILPITEKGHPKMLLFLFTRALCGATAAILHYYAMQYISMADATVIAFSSPVFVSLASHFFLGEKSGFIPIICGVITLTGVAIITRPPILTGGEEFDKETLLGSGLALACMLCSISTYLILRYIRRMHFSIITGYFGLWGSLQSMAMSVTLSKLELPEGYNDWMLAVGLGVLTFTGQAFMTLSLKYEQAGTISLCRTCDILFAYLWQFVILDVVPDQYSMIGGGIVVLGIVVATIRKYVMDLPETSPARKRWWFLLT